MFNYKYSPRESDPAWFGFFKVECKDCSGFPSYIRVGCECFLCYWQTTLFYVNHTLQTHITLVMLVACSYSVQRRQVRNYVFTLPVFTCWVIPQKRYYLHNFIDIPKADKMALFWGISIDEMDKSLLKTVAYLVSHIFDLYGLEVQNS